MFLTRALFLLEEMGDELIEAPTPCEPLMMCAWRHVVIDIDACSAEHIHQLTRSEVLLASTTEEEIVHVAVELISLQECAVIGFLKIDAEDGSAEGTHV